MRVIGSQIDKYAVITVGMAAKKLNKSERQVRRLLAQGKLKGVKVDGPRGPQWLLDPDCLYISTHCGSMQLADCSVSIDSTKTESSNLQKVSAKSQEDSIMRIIGFFRALCAAFVMRLSTISDKA